MICKPPTALEFSLTCPMKERFAHDMAAQDKRQEGMSTRAPFPQHVARTLFLKARIKRRHQEGYSWQQLLWQGSESVKSSCHDSPPHSG